MMKYKIFGVLVVATMLVAACGTDGNGEVMTELTSAEMENMSATETPAMTEEEMMDTEEETMDEVSFSEDIYPILEEYAFAGHGNSGGVNLETYENVMKVVEPGNPEGSLLYRHLTGDGVPVMPPSGKLDDEMIQLFYDWIAAGAKNN